MTDNARPDEWLYVGAPVAEFAYGRGGPRDHVKFSTVSKIGKRDVVLSNGARYNGQGLYRRAGGPYGTGWHLLPPTDPRVRRASDAARRRRIAADVSAAIAQWAESGDDEVIRVAAERLRASMKQGPPTEDVSA